MKTILRWYAPHAYNDGLRRCNEKGLALLPSKPVGRMLDLGCEDGTNTLFFAKKVQPKEIYSLEYSDESIKKASQKGITCIKADLNKPWPVDENYFDIILSSQNIEHMHNTRFYLKECYRCLKKGGRLLILTENLASWINIGALLFGWQPFSATNIDGISVGNPLIWHTDNIDGKPPRASEYSKYNHEGVTGVLGHVRVLTYQGLRELLHSVGFKHVDLSSSGYLPFWGGLSALLCRIDKRHGHFLIASARK